jgi:CRISPR/Cas system-associated exonuclease Cas4 (RecB family)
MMARNLVSNLKFKKYTGAFDPETMSKMLDEAYLGGKNNKKFMKKTTFSPSTVGYGHGTCPRYWYIAFEGAEFTDSFDAISIANMSTGVAAHERLQEMFKKTGTVKAIEQEIIKNHPPIKGYADVVLDWETKTVVGEIKTTKDEAYLFRQNSMEPSRNHLLQILIYMDVMETDEGFVLYENKNNQEILIIPVKMTESNREFLDSCYAWMKEVYLSWGHKEMPKRPFRRNNNICKNCPVADTCFEMEDGEKLIPVLKI